MIAFLATLVVPAIGQARPAWCGSDAVRAIDLPGIVPTAACDLQGVTIRVRGVGVAVPPAGTSVQLSALLSDGQSESLIVRTALDGTVTIDSPGADANARRADAELMAQTATGDDKSPVDPSVGTVSGTECKDDYYGGFVHGGEHDVHEWYMNSASIPDYLGKHSDVIVRIREGGAHITQGTTDCDVELKPDLQLSYQGTTSAVPDITPEVTCKPNSDGRNVVGFADLPPSVTGVTCNWLSDFFSELQESDIVFNNDPNEKKFFATDEPPKPCDGSLDLEGTATHERGHTFGLSDISPADHPDLTMRGSGLTDCSTEKRTLGKGDILALNTLY